MPDPTPAPDPAADGARAAAPAEDRSRSRPSGWPLWLRLSLAAVILAFVWSPFLAMLGRMSQVKPALQPTGSPPVLAPAPAPATPSARSGP